VYKILVGVVPTGSRLSWR